MSLDAIGCIGRHWMAIGRHWMAKFRSLDGIGSNWSVFGVHWMVFSVRPIALKCY